jgi:anti-sigma regulatory factor (Ser/Thr protein kinase)
MTTDLAPPSAGFCHEALLYADDREFLERVVPFVRDGVEGGDAVLVATDARKGELIRTELGTVDLSGGGSLEILDMATVGQNPGRIITVWADFLRTHGGEGRRPRGVGEPVWPERSEDELTECLYHELALNLAFGDDDFWLICPYDVSMLPPEVVEASACSHPLMWEPEGHRHSGAYRHVDSADELFVDPLRPATGPLRLSLTVDLGSSSAARRSVRQLALDLGFDALRASDVALAASEATSNSVRHGGGTGRLVAWVDESSLVLEVCDRGQVQDPLAGRLRVPPTSPSGRGLWLIHQISDLAQLRTGASGTTLRMRFDLPS